MDKWLKLIAKKKKREIRTHVNEIKMAKNYDFTLTDDDLYEGYNTGEIISLIDEKELKTKGYSVDFLISIQIATFLLLFV